MPNPDPHSKFVGSFHDDGFVRIPVAFSRDEADEMLSVIWAALTEVHGIHREDPSTWNIERPTKLQEIKQHPAFDAIGSEKTFAAINDLLGPGRWQMPNQWGGFHIAFPTGQTRWDVPHGAWHADFHYTHPAEPLFGLVVFSFMADVKAGGGGTVALKSSHKLVQQFINDVPNDDRKQYAEIRKRIAGTDAWLKELMDAPAPGGESSVRVDKFYNNPQRIHGVDVEVIEFTAQAGDVILMHPWLLHTASTNCNDQPRVMRVKAIYCREPENAND